MSALKVTLTSANQILAVFATLITDKSNSELVFSVV